MPWFYCDDCGDSIKKPKIAAHNARCSASSYTCIDCSLVFDRNSVNGHTQCVTEHEKYAQGATKPGGFAAKGFVADPASTNNTQQQAPVSQVEGAQFLTTRYPWKCNLCNVNCTSEETLKSHAAGTKHKRKVRAVLAAQNGTTTTAQNTQNTDATENDKSAEEANNKRKKASEDKDDAAANNNTSSKKKKIKSAKWKKLAVAELKKQGGSMKLKKLLSAIITEAGLSKKDESIVEQATAKLKKSKRFAIDGKTITLNGGSADDDNDDD